MGFDVKGKVRDLESKYSLPAGLYEKVIFQGERSSSNRAVSPKGAIGWAQLMPGTAAEVGVRNIWDDEENLEGGAKYLAKMYAQFKDPVLAAAAYNAGPGAVRKHGGVPPFKETQDYVRRLFGMEAAPAGTPPTAALGGKPTAGMPPLPGSDALSQKLMTQYELEMAQNQKVNAEVDKELSGIQTRMKEISSTLTPTTPRPVPPQLANLPEVPDEKDYIKDPNRVLGQVLPALTILGSLTMRNGAINSMKAATAAMNAVRQRDIEALDRANKTWKQEMESTLAQADRERQQYIDLLEDRRLSTQEKLAEMQALNAQGQNAQLRAMISKGDLGGIYNFFNMQQMMTYRGWQVLDEAQKRDIDRERLDLDNRKLSLEEKKAANLDRFRTRQNELKAASANKQTMSNLVAKLMEEKRAGTTAAGEPWDAADDAALQEAVETYQRTNWDAAGTAGGATPPSAGDKPVVTNRAVAYLKENDTPEMRRAFDEKYGQGAAKKYLGH